MIVSFFSIKGGVALEYLVVSLFALGVTLFLLGVVGKVSEEKFRKMAAQLNLDIEDIDFDIFRN